MANLKGQILFSLSMVKGDFYRPKTDWLQIIGDPTSFTRQKWQHVIHTGTALEQRDEDGPRQLVTVPNTPLYFVSSQVMIGCMPKASADINVMVHRFSDWALVVPEGWDHYQDPVAAGANDHIFGGEYELAPGDGLAMALYVGVTREQDNDGEVRPRWPWPDAIAQVTLRWHEGD